MGWWHKVVGVGHVISTWLDLLVRIFWPSKHMKLWMKNIKSILLCGLHHSIICIFYTFFSYNRHKVIEKKIKLQISLIKLLSLVYRVLVTNHRVEFFEPIFSLKFVTFLPLTFAKTFLGPWELLPLIIYIPPSPNIFYTSNVV